jgi:hypothetical protein
MCSKRVFSNKDLTIDYKDYNKIKNGCEILKTIKREDPNAILNQFKNYNSWQSINTAYFKYIDINRSHIGYLTDLYSANESFIEKSCPTDLNICKQEKNILYPYGNIIEKTNTITYFPTKICLNQWCNKNVVKDNDNDNNCIKEDYSCSEETCSCSKETDSCSEETCSCSKETYSYSDWTDYSTKQTDDCSEGFYDYEEDCDYAKQTYDYVKQTCDYVKQAYDYIKQTNACEEKDDHVEVKPDYDCLITNEFQKHSSKKPRNLFI